MIKLFTIREESLNGVMQDVMRDLGMKISSITELFANLDAVLSKFEEHDRFNIHHSICNVKDSNGRVFESQEVIAFDLDKIEMDKLDEYIDIFARVVKLKRDQLTIVNSGNGLHIYIFLDYIIDTIEFFNENRVYYKTLAGILDYEFKKAKLAGSVDSLVFAPSRTLRTPNTLNVKRGKLQKHSSFIHLNTTPIDWRLEDCIKIEQIKVEDQIAEKSLKHLKLHTGSVLKGCSFLNWCKSNQDEVSEGQWYAMLSILARLENAQDLAHEYSCMHHSYTEEETDIKLEYASANSGPRTCNNIATMYSGCATCPHYGKIASPIMIKSDEYIETEATGFWFIKQGKGGMPVQDKPDYDGLIKKFSLDHNYVTISTSKLVYIFNGTHWVEMEIAEIEGYCYSSMNPKPSGTIRREFLQRIQCTNLVKPTFFENETGLNFTNGWLDLKTRELHEHSSSKGFLYCLPYDYDPTQNSPLFDKFLKEITCNDSTLENILLEYGGYCLSDISPSQFDKCLLLYGTGANGKSVFLDVLKEVAGKENYTSLTMKDIDNPTHRYQLYGKLFNVAEETPHHSLADSSAFKTLTSGGDIIAKKLYAQPFSMKTNAKFMFACNSLPPSNDTTNGLYRRLLVVPFNAKFTEATMDRDLRKKLKQETSGILNRLLEGYQRLITQQRFTSSVAADQEVADYISSNNIVAGYLSEFCEEFVPVDIDIRDMQEGTHFEFVDSLYLEYKTWAETCGDRPVPMVLFTKELKKMYPQRQLRKLNPANGRKQTIIQGIRRLSRSSF